MGLIVIEIQTMKYLITIIIIIAFTYNIKAQDNAVSWTYTTEKGEKDGEYKLIYNAEITKGWHLYSQFLPSPDAGPLPTEFVYTEYENITMIN